MDYILLVWFVFLSWRTPGFCPKRKTGIATVNVGIAWAIFALFEAAGCLEILMKLLGFKQRQPEAGA